MVERSTKQRFKSIAAAGTNTDGRYVFVELLDSSEAIHRLEFPDAMLGGMVLALIDQGRKLEEAERNATELTSQFTALTDVRSMQISDGRLGLALTFEQSIKVAATLTPDMRRHLRRALDTIDCLSTEQPQWEERH